MNSRVSLRVDGIDPSIRERAEAAARRAGMSLNDWLDSALGDPTPTNVCGPYDQQPSMQNRETPREVADIHQRLDAIARKIELMSRPAPRNDAARGQPAVAQQLNDAISRLDARLSQISNPQAARQTQPQSRQREAETREPATARTFRSSPASFDSAIAEIAPRQNERDMPPRNAAPIVSYAAPTPQPTATASPDFSSLERHLIKIASQIEALQRPDHIEQSIAIFRGELADIRQAIIEAMPRRAIESIENEIRSLHSRIDDTRQNSSDDQALASVERALGEIREVLESLTPAEQLAGYDEAIRNLGAKLDLILRSSDDPTTVHQLETAIAALRSIVSNVASNDALARLSDDVQALAARVEQISQTDRHSDALAIIEQRIAALTAALESRERPAAENSELLENAIRALSERIDRMQVSNDSASTFAHLEQRVSHLLERLEASCDPHAINFGRVEEGLQDILHHLEHQQASLVSLAENSRGMSAASAQPIDGDVFDIVRRELSDIRFNQSETDRRTQESLETVHNTLGHVVDRLAMIEGDLRTVRSPPIAAPVEIRGEAPRMARPQPVPPQPMPELPNPALAQEHFVAAPRDFRAAEPATPPARSAIDKILEPQAVPSRAAIAPELPPDHPLEPGTWPVGRMSTTSERITASENAIVEISSARKEPVSTSSFIAAARRAAQAAAQTADPEGARNILKASAGAGATDKAGNGSTISSRIRSLLVGASVIVIVLGTYKTAMTLFDSGSPLQMPAMEDISEPVAPTQSPADNAAAPAVPSMTSPLPIGRQFNNTSAPNTLDSAQVPVPPATATTSPADADVTGTVTAPQPPSPGKLSTVQVPPSERLPDSIGGPMLRTAAMNGDPTAAYEIGLRFAEGKGVAQNFDEAAKWYERAAQAGVVPAIFRLGTFYEKGLGVRKDVLIARRYYVQAAERGNAKAMHNLAVLDFDSGGKSPNYARAAQWFRKAADRGVADSQFNLGILYSRGIGVGQNLAESFKWFSLAAAQGDADAGHKRDEVAPRIDAQSLAAAKLAIQAFTTEPQPDDAVNVATPAGGWDNAPLQPAVARPAVKPAAKRINATVATVIAR